MKKATLILIFIVVLSGCAWAYCSLDWSCKRVCVQNCKSDGYNYMTCERICTNMCTVCE
jgi:hypothetical protein